MKQHKPGEKIAFSLLLHLHPPPPPSKKKKHHLVTLIRYCFIRKVFGSHSERQELTIRVWTYGTEEDRQRREHIWTGIRTAKEAKKGGGDRRTGLAAAVGGAVGAVGRMWWMEAEGWEGGGGR